MDEPRPVHDPRESAGVREVELHGLRLQRGGWPTNHTPISLSLTLSTQSLQDCPCASPSYNLNTKVMQVACSGGIVYAESLHTWKSTMRDLRPGPKSAKNPLHLPLHLTARVKSLERRFGSSLSGELLRMPDDPKPQSNNKRERIVRRTLLRKLRLVVNRRPSSSCG